jgi:sialic acid synthase SpsE
MNQKFSIDKWREIFHKQKDSGLSIKDWCEKNNVDVSTFNYQYTQIRESEKQEVQWLKISPPEVYLTKELTIVDDSTPIIINIGKLSISVQRGFDKETLAELLAVLQISC